MTADGNSSDEGNDFLRDRWREKYYDKVIELNAAESALNQIYILGKGELAYTSAFTEQVMQIAHKALTGKDRGL